jgi:transketolase
MCVEAAKSLDAEGIDARVVNMSTVKPLDFDAIRKAAKDTGAIVTAEEHSVLHGMGSAVAVEVARTRPVPMEFVGMPDHFGESGDAESLLQKYGLTAAKIAEAAMKVVKLRGG